MPPKTPMTLTQVKEKVLSAMRDGRLVARLDPLSRTLFELWCRNKPEALANRRVIQAGAVDDRTRQQYLFEWQDLLTQDGKNLEAYRLFALFFNMFGYEGVRALERKNIHKPKKFLKLYEICHQDLQEMAKRLGLKLR